MAEAVERESGELVVGADGGVVLLLLAQELPAEALGVVGPAVLKAEDQAVVPVGGAE